MADDPIIIDDGGSTRIKLLLKSNGIGEMDALLDVKKLPASTPVKPYDNKPGSQTKVDHNGTAYRDVKVTFIDRMGNAFIRATTFTDFVETTSADQMIRCELIAGGDARITVYGGCEPKVEAKQHKRKRRYIVSNAPPIDTIVVDGVPLLDVSAPSEPGLDRPIIYTTVVIS